MSTDNNAKYCKYRKLIVKLQVFALYGSVCNKCNFSDYRALQLDHIKQATEKHNENMRGGTSLYYAIYMGKKDPKDYQLVCANCNWIKRHENEEHCYSVINRPDYISPSKLYNNLIKTIDPKIALEMLKYYTK